jgi:hypothetical protein
MNFSTFTESLKETTPPDTSVYIRALWYDAKDDWKTAHDLIDQMNDKKACWLHAYLHRKEGDIWNADYWYSRAGKKRPAFSLTAEWEELAKAFLNEEKS